VFRAVATWPQELDGIVEQVKKWTGPGEDLFSVAVAVPERRHVAEIEARLNQAGVSATAIGPDGPRDHDAVHVGTLHRFKGLEYQRMILAGICDGVIPGAYVEEFRVSDPLRYRREIKQARSLLFVAATRARDSLAISWHGKPSVFLPVQKSS
jgi:superfamily I DNA/RNA helicase